MRNTLEKQTLETPRLILRQWRESDVAPFAEMNADRKVMQYFPETLSHEESTHLFERYQQHFNEYGFGLWAVEVKDQAEFVGFIGLAVPQFTAYFTPCVEICWRLAAPYWNQGIATEGAQATLDFGFNHCNLKEVVGFTVPANVASRRVMEKIGMSYIDNFDHPAIPGDAPLSRHVLYRITKAERDAFKAG